MSDKDVFTLGRGVGLAILALSCAGPSTAATGRPAGPVPLRPLALRFEPNVGQTDPQVRFLSSSQNGDVFLAPGEIVLSMHEGGNGGVGKRAVVRLNILDANPNPRVVGLDPLPGQTNYFIGNDPTKWRTNVPAFARVRFEDVYPGIDLVAYGNDGNLEYDFQVNPGADPEQIAMSIEGADGVALDACGDLVLRTALGEIRQCAPRIYQRDDAGTHHEIAGGYVVRGTETVAFTLAAYDASRPLIIDPQLAFATYFGGSTETDIHALAVDSTGAIYVAGDTYAHDFPTKSPEQSANGHDQSLSAIVSKFSSDGASLVYSTYLGGSGSFSIDVAVGIALDSTGAAYVAGTAGSLDFPTKNSILGKGNGIFVTKLSADGSSLVYSSVYGGSGFDNPRGITLDSSNKAYIFGDTQSTDFPTVNPTQASSGGGGYKDGFWSVISADGSQLLFSTYVGGNNDDDIRDLGVFPQTGDVWFTGQTQSSDFVNNGAGALLPFQGYYGKSGSGTYTVQAQAYLASIIPTPALSSFNGGTAAVRNAADGSLSCTSGCGEALNHGIHTASAEASSTDIELFASGYCAVIPPATTCSANSAILFEDARTLTVKSAINLPDLLPIVTFAVHDAHNAVYVAGVAQRNDTFPLVAPIQGASGGSTDTFVIVFAPVTREITFSTFLGGSGHDELNGFVVDPEGNIYVAGQTTSDNFPTVNAYQATAPAPNGVSIGEGNSFLVKFSSGVPQPVLRKPVEPAKPRQDSTHDLPLRPLD